MAIRRDDLYAMLASAFPGARIDIEDTRGDGDHYQVRIISSVFEGMTRVAQHKAVFHALGDLMADRLHALSLKTLVPLKE